MIEENKRIVEINGIKMEIDLRHAKRVDHFKVGDQVKVLIKEYPSYKSYPGVIVGFDEFVNLPTIIVAYLDTSYGNTGVKFTFINANSRDENNSEIVMAHEFEYRLEYEKALDNLNNAIINKEREKEMLVKQRDYFKNICQKTFGEFTNV